MELVHVLITVTVWTLCSINLSNSLSSSSYQLFHSRQSYATTASIKLQCREETLTSLNFKNVADVKFWLDRTSPSDPSLREQDDVTVIETEDGIGIIFNLTRNLEGNYTCGRRNDSENVHESPPLTLISHQRTVSLPVNFTGLFTAIAGSVATIQCPTAPGRLRQYYSVRWRKGYGILGELYDGSHLTNLAARHSIDNTTFSLIIDNVEVGDGGSGYNCLVVVRDPLSYNGQTRIRLEADREVSLGLQVIGKPTISPTNITVTNHEYTSFNCTVNYKNPQEISPPHITWTYVVGEEESPLIESDHYHRELISMTEEDSGEFTTTSILGMLNTTRLFLATNDKAIVRCKVDDGKAIADAHLYRPEEATT